MTNYPFTGIEQFDDIEAKNTWKAEVLTNRVSPEDFLDHFRKTSRDHSRTPMQWDDSLNAGFTSADKPWFAVNPNYQEINAKQAVADSNSVYKYYQAIIQLRKTTPAFIYGDYDDIDPEHPSLFSYTRTLGSESYLVVLNFSRNTISFPLRKGLKAGSLVLSNTTTEEETNTELHLNPWDARIYRLSN
jgi:oligo-1,6-glucosidase